MVGNVTLSSTVALPRGFVSPLILAKYIKVQPVAFSPASTLLRRPHQLSTSWKHHSAQAPSWPSLESRSIAVRQPLQRPRRNPISESSLWRASTLHGSTRNPSSRTYLTSIHRRAFSASSRNAESGKKTELRDGKQESFGTEPASETSRSSKSLYDRLPNIQNYHRPTREELLAAATGFWSRLKIRFKWFSIRSARPFNSDEIGALFSWVLLGHILWIVLGTTTFASLVILTCNTVFAQETLARWVGNYLTKSSGITVVFESAIVPRWKSGVITFKNVFVSRRPGHHNARVSKGSPETAAAAAAAATALAERAEFAGSPEDEDTNYTQYDLTLNTVNVTLSFTKWFNGQGLLSDVEVKGVRGVIDRSQVHSVHHDVDPKSYRHQYSPGDFEIDSFKMEDFLVTIHQPGGFRPFSVSIFSCDLPKLRQRWLFYDFLCANNVSGSFDDSLFTIHPRQVPGRAVSQFADQVTDDSPSPWMKQSRLRIDSLAIDHLNTGTEGPFSWFHEGAVDLVADIMFPAEADEGLLAMLMSELKNTRVAMSKQRSSLAEQGLAQTIESLVKPSSAATSTPEAPKDDKRFLVLDLRVNFLDVRAAVPLFTRDLNYVNNALIRPIVGYINSRHTHIPITCRLAKRVSDFDGSWTLYDSGLLDDLSAETYTAIVRDISDDQARIRRFKKVGLWSLQLAAQALFMGMAGVIA